MRRWRGLWLAALLGWTLNGTADGLIVVHEPLPWHPPAAPPPGGWRPAAPRPYAFAPLEVRYHRVDVEIKNQVATTRVDQEFYNPNDRQLEGTYLFPIPPGAHIDKFSLEIGGKPVEAELLAADKARQIYEDIVRRMKDPALLEYAGRDVFKVRVYPIEARAAKRIKLAYTQLLKADAGLTSYLYPLNTEKFSASPIQTVSLKVQVETSHPLKTVYSPTHPVEVRRTDPTHATVGYETSGVRPDTDFQLYFGQENQDVGMSLMTHRKDGEEGYFLLLAAPGLETRAEAAVAKDVVFVLDTSGSMAGKKLDQAKKALLFCLENLNAQDRFDVARFSTEVETLFGKLTEADKPNRDRAAAFVNALQPMGGTALDEAFRRGLSLRPADSTRPYLIVLLTDGRPTVGTTDEQRILEGVRDVGGGKTRVFCFGLGSDVNTHLLDKVTEDTRAFSQYVLPEEDIEVKVSSFFTKIKEPVLANPTIAFPEGVRTGRTHPAALPDLFRGDQLTLVGRYRGASAGQIAIEGKVDGQPRRFAYEARFPERSHENDFIPRLWATRRVGYLLDEIRLHGEQAELREEVTDLARKYGIVTPYTAYLILEDETRRQVPLAQQSLPRLNENSASRQWVNDSYRRFQNDKTGDAAVGGARYGLALRRAENASLAIDAGNAAAFRGMGGQPLAGASPMTLNRQPLPGQLPEPPFGPTTGVQAGAADADGEATAPDRFGQQARFVNGRGFYQNGNQWVDAGAQRLANGKKERIQFSSAAYFELARQRPEAGPWLALGQNVAFVIGDTLYEIYE